MKARYEFLDHTADIAVKIYGSSYKQLFVNAVYAWREMVCGESQIDRISRKNIKLSVHTYEELLVELLSEINYLLTVKRWLVSEMSELNLNADHTDISCHAVLTGESLQQDKHEIELEIKAITFHKMDIVKKNNLYETVVVFDI